jgi:hypothetical protein
MTDDNRNPFAFGGRQDDDKEVRALLGRWIELRRGADRAYEADNLTERERLLCEADAVQAQITTAQPSAIGLAAKVYLFLHLDFFNYLAHDSAAIAPGKLFEGGWHPAGDLAFATAMLRDAVTFLPELAPLAEPVLAAAKGGEAQP